MENDISIDPPARLSTTARIQAMYGELCLAHEVIADCKPLAIGALKELVAMGYQSRIVGLVLFKHVQKSAYLRAIAAGGERFHIDGSTAGSISDEHRAHAAARIAEFAAKARAKKAAAEVLKQKSSMKGPAELPMTDSISRAVDSVQNSTDSLSNRRTLSLPVRSGSKR